MILSERLVQGPKREVGTGKRLTIPGLGVDVLRAMQQYAKGTLEERAKGFYEQEGLEIPDFARMSKVERLLALNKYRDDAKQAREQIATISMEVTEKRKQKAKADDTNTKQPGSAS